LIWCKKTFYNINYKEKKMKSKKSKESGKKLNVSKETIAHLDTKSMSRLYGGSKTEPGTGTDPKVPTEYTC
jgi:hypothetical protein